MVVSVVSLCSNRLMRRVEYEVRFLCRQRRCKIYLKEIKYINDISFIVSIGLSIMLVSPLKRSGEELCHYLCVCFLLSSCFSRGRGLYLQLVTFQQWGVLYRCAAEAESDRQVQFWASWHKGWSGAMWVGIGLRKGEWRGQGGGSHAGGDREFFLFAKVQL